MRRETATVPVKERGGDAVAQRAFLMRDSFEIEFLEGVALFNEERFYECHDAIEDIWLRESSDQRAFLQGLIQAAVAFHHYQEGKWGAARSMLRLSLEKLEDTPDGFRGVLVAPLRAELALWKSTLDSVLPDGSREALTLPYPKIRRLDAQRA